MKQINIALQLMAVALFFAFGCKKAEIGHTTSCDYIPNNNHPKAQQYQAVLDEYSAKGLPGISVLIRDQSGLWAGASGKADISKNVEMAPCTVSKAASLTKTFVAVLALKLVEENKFSLDDPLTKWLPQAVLDKVKNAKECTVRQLMNHTTGIADIIEDNTFYLAILNNPSRKWKPLELVAYVYGDAPLFAPGTDISYSNTNFLLLAMVIEAATGQEHGKLLREKVIEPLHLDHTFYYWHDDIPETVAQGYFDLYNNGTILNMTNYNTGSGNGYGGIYSDVFDLQQFIEALVREKNILKPESLAQMLTFTNEEAETNRANGLGIFKDFLDRAPDEYAYGHRGRDLGYTADMFWFPEKDYTITYLVNYGTDAKSGLRQTFLDFRKAIIDAMMEN